MTTPDPFTQTFTTEMDFCHPCTERTIADVTVRYTFDGTDFYTTTDFDADWMNEGAHNAIAVDQCEATPDLFRDWADRIDAEHAPEALRRLLAWASAYDGDELVAEAVQYLRDGIASMEIAA
jgi:hypothetical protein